ncbi:MAE_28990/MAE_18760 family HEPN-like nuclease [Chromobacterium aquaticum]|uniref:MAE_28990/MAE_18760 family HEPN-like nuclease n=1 Tax=Chromobacterium aquaticum TaxID=467180 RepID=A0ABV8ZTM9_9NEIS|nr:MAE_28990/MAE_18760 family HEPN-like nuclease [Chromobacterium aquaticum]MCD5362569.1 hypothetical protein [Chromobacterium aquaticum]
MSDVILNEISERFRQAKDLIDFAKRLEEGCDARSSCIKGMVFVSLYAVVEFSVTRTCEYYFEKIHMSEKKFSEFTTGVACLMLEPFFKSLIEKKDLFSKKNVLDKFFLGNAVPIGVGVYPVSSSANIGYVQIKDMWRLIGLPGEGKPQGVTGVYFDEIKDKRNAVSHGRVTAQEVGARYSIMDLEKRLDFVEKFYVHLLEAFSSYYERKHYLCDC